MPPPYCRMCCTVGTRTAHAAPSPSLSCWPAAAFGVFARLLLHNAPAFLQFFQRVAATLPAHATGANGTDPTHALLLAYLDIW